MPAHVDANHEVNNFMSRPLAAEAALLVSCHRCPCLDPVLLIVARSHHWPATLVATTVLLFCTPSARPAAGLQMAATMWLPRVKLDVLLQEAFLQLDKDDDGLITVSELAAFLSATDLRAMLLREAPGSPCSNGAAGSVAALVSTTTASTAKEHAASLAACAIEEADTDGDSKLSLSEFVAAVTGTGGVPAPQPAAMLLPGAVPEQLV